MNKLYLLIVFLCFTVIIGCNATNNEIAVSNDYFKPTTKGIQNGGVQMIPITTPSRTFNVWTKRIGNNPTMKLLLLNGGPGATHEYFECFENFMPAEGIEIIYYDQLGCGNSQDPKDTSLFDLARYVDEVEQVRKALNLNQENFYLLGHSWGGILAMEYALKYQQNLKGVIISNMMSDAVEYGKYADEVLAKQMDPKILDTIRGLEAKKDFTNPKYMDLLYNHFYTKHILRMPLNEWPEPVNRSFAKMNQALYVTMQGPSEFGISGKLTTWSVKNQLKQITVPALVVGSEHDTMDPAHMKWMAGAVQNGTYLYCANGGHMSMYDDQETYFKGLIHFVKGVNKGEKKNIVP
ncbi:proline iminopeptidase-family hydrolase [Sediminibacterium sp.]|uniref:proline iminopeptidase-family hydrolase n=1 Tax=Sediminibacterium sp. TaxID=1917865 RepID=UPI002720AAA0|nr:proline iminopeptidase-family hydrolase [Sediminibacterium sp.]MDO9156494.1 proline iminopeptidase-family hydrolase [Sediminibacterium sp.]MDP2422112.1 proline iminopeptidase-family hydrolase [Sediminibacterium sp.]